MGEAEALDELARTLAQLNFNNSLLVDANRLRTDTVSAIERNAQAFDDLASMLCRSTALMSSTSARRDRLEAMARRASSHATDLHRRCDVLKTIHIGTPRPDTL